MHITLEYGPLWTFVVRNADGQTRLVQHDTDFLGVAATFGWPGRQDDLASIWDAFEFLEHRAGTSVDDPGYF